MRILTLKIGLFQHLWYIDGEKCLFKVVKNGPLIVICGPDLRSQDLLDYPILRLLVTILCSLSLSHVSTWKSLLFQCRWPLGYQQLSKEKYAFEQCLVLEKCTRRYIIMTGPPSFTKNYSLSFSVSFIFSFDYVLLPIFERSLPTQRLGPFSLFATGINLNF